MLLVRQTSGHSMLRDADSGIPCAANTLLAFDDDVVDVVVVVAVVAYVIAFAVIRIPCYLLPRAFLPPGANRVCELVLFGTCTRDLFAYVLCVEQKRFVRMPTLCILHRVQSRFQFLCVWLVNTICEEC